MLYEFAGVESTSQYWVRSSVLNALAVRESFPELKYAGIVEGRQ